MHTALLIVITWFVSSVPLALGFARLIQVNRT